MPYKRTIGSLVVVAAALLVAPLGLPAPAEAHGRVFVGAGFGGFYGWGPYWGMGWGWGWPYWGWPGPYSYGYGGSPALGYAMMSGMGALDLNVKPNQAEVWVDGKYVADARDLDGDPSYLWLKQGPHHLVIYKAGYRSFEQDVEVHTALMRELKVKLEKGESQPPVSPPAPPSSGPGVRREPPRPEGTEMRAEPPSPESAEMRAQAPEASREPGGDVTLRIEPRDASVYVDGQYRGTARELRRLRLSPGHHRVELARPGFQPLQKEFEVEADKATELGLSMEKGGGLKY